MAWFWLILGGMFEVGFTTSLRYVEGFRNIPWPIAFLVSVRLSMGKYSESGVPNRPVTVRKLRRLLTS